LRLIHGRTLIKIGLISPRTGNGSPCQRSWKASVMTIRRISSGPGLPAGFPFSLASEYNGVLYISGMPSLDSEGRFPPRTFEQEADRPGPISLPSPLPAATPETSFSTCKCCSPTSATMAMSTTGSAASSRTRPWRRPGSPSRLARSRSGPRSNYKLSPHTTGKEIHGRIRYRNAARQPLGVYGGWIAW